jgi:PKD repeat protein
VVRFTEDGPYNISLTVSNINGENTLTREAYIRVGGFELPYFEDFESMQGDELSGWEIENPDNAKTWELTEVAGNEPGNKAAYVNIFDYVGPSQRDRLISPAFNLSDYDNASISFKYAYAQKYPQISDSLIVYISTDCGDSWTRIFNGGDDGSGNFATHELTTEEFIPQEAADWCGNGYGAECVNIDITNYTGQANIKFMFETYSFLGNNIFLDDVMISNSVGIGNNHTSQGEVEIYPNPSKGFFIIKANALNKEVKCEIFSVHGNMVYEKNITTKNGLIHEDIDLDDIAEGVYFIKLRSGDEQRMKRIILQ